MAQCVSFLLVFFDKQRGDGCRNRHGVQKGRVGRAHGSGLVTTMESGSGGASEVAVAKRVDRSRWVIEWWALAYMK